MFRHSEATLRLRLNLWRSIFVLDRFLAASLGRPTAISEDDCSDAVLERPLGADYPGVDAAVRTSRVIGDILKKIYATQRVETKVAEGIVRQCVDWPRGLHAALRERRALANPKYPGQGIAVLHVNLLYYHSVILFTRPFFVQVVQHYLTQQPLQSHPVHPRRPSRPDQMKDVYSQICVTASCQTIAMVQTVYEAGYLPKRNPFVM